MRNKKILALLIFMFLGSALHVLAQESEEKENFSGWYIGGQVGSPFAKADFSSLGADKFRPGWSVGFHTGYTFNRMFSLEFLANWGQQVLTAQDCCFDRNYFLGEDFKRYRVAPSDLKGYYYNDLKSNVFLQRYALQSNINVLSFFKFTKDTPWTLDLSPVISAVFSNTDIQTKEDNKTFKGNVNNCNLGIGGNVALSYDINDDFKLGVYSGFTHLIGKHIDAIPTLHTNNFIVDLGIKMSINLGKRKSVKKTTVMAAPSSDISYDVVKDETEEQPIIEEADVEIKFPIIYFPFNKSDIENSEIDKVIQISDIMKKYPSMRIKVIGWADEVGTYNANKRISIQRANAVKQVLMRLQISGDRIEAIGQAVNYDAPTHDAARNVTVVEIK